MEIKITTQQVLKLLYIVSWVLFIGLCVDAGGFLFNTIYTQTYNAEGARYFWNHLDLSSVYATNKGQFLVLTTLVCIVAVLKVILFWVIIRFQFYKRLDLSKPFNESLRRFILNIGYTTLGISLFALWGQRYASWLATKGSTVPAHHLLGLAGADVWIFMSVSLFVISQILKRGIEIQSENELTV